MNSILHIYPKSQEKDFQRQGFFGNTDFGIKHCPTIKLLPFFFDIIDSPVTITEFSIKRISDHSTRNEVIISDTVTLDTNKLIVAYSSFNTRITFNADTEILGLGLGKWYYYIKLNSNGTDFEFESELLYIPSSNDIIDDLADFNNDFNNDYLI